MTTSPILSIIVPSFNQGDFIESTILSVLKQDFHDWELIIQDGGSKDSTEAVCKAYEKRDSRIRFYSEKDKGFADAVNKAIDKAKGTIAAIQSSDDFYSSSQVFTEAVRIFREKPDLILVSAYHCSVDKDLQEICVTPKEQKQVNGLIEASKLYNLGVHFPQSSTFFNLERARLVGKLDENVDMVADTDFWIRLANYSPIHKSGIFRHDELWSCVIVHESQRSVDQCQFALGRAKMYFRYLTNQRLEVSQDVKFRTFYGNLIDAVEYFNAQKKDDTELRKMYESAYKQSIPIRWKIKSAMSKLGILRKLIYKNVPQRSSLDLLAYPRGKSFNWFKANEVELNQINVNESER
ncbi:MAG: glycosyltransferase [Bacteroidia bacterium]|nr:glycosyltransferase [Bacteroidia bacterium]